MYPRSFKAVDSDLNNICITEALRFVAPIDSIVPEAETYFCILTRHTDTKEILKRFSLLKTPMGDSKIYEVPIANKSSKRKIQEVEDKLGDMVTGEKPGKGKEKPRVRAKGRQRQRHRQIRLVVC